MCMTDTWSTTFLAEFSVLETCHITFGAGWSLALVGFGLDKLHRLRDLTLRRIPAMAITQTIQCPGAITLHALDVMCSRIPLASRARSIAVHCDTEPLDLFNFDVPLDTLEHLAVSTTGILCMPRGLDIPKLESLKIACDIFFIPDMKQWPALTRVDIQTTDSILVDDVSSLPAHPDAEIHAVCQDKPFNLVQALS